MTIQEYSPSSNSVKLLDGVTSTGAGDWFRLPLNKVFSVTGISTATVDIEYRASSDHTEATLYSFTADGSQANSDAIYEVRANVSAYTSGTITVTATYVDNVDTK